MPDPETSGAAQLPSVPVLHCQMIWSQLMAAGQSWDYAARMDALRRAIAALPGVYQAEVREHFRKLCTIEAREAPAFLREE